MDDKQRNTPLSLSDAMLNVLGLEADDAKPGNVAAHAVRETVGSGGLDGIQLGWADMDASTDFLVGVVLAVDEGDHALVDGEVDCSSIADEAVPIYTSEVIETWEQLRNYADDDEGLCSPDDDIEQRMKVALYVLAEQVAAELGRKLADAQDEDEDD
jgi:hypothetical protein